MSLTACGPGGFSTRGTEDALGTTGFAEKGGRSYTLGGDQRAVKAVETLAPKDPARPTPEEKARVELGASIQTVKIERLDKNLNVDRFGQYSTRVEISVSE